MLHRLVHHEVRRHRLVGASLQLPRPLRRLLLALAVRARDRRRRALRDRVGPGEQLQPPLVAAAGVRLELLLDEALGAGAGPVPERGLQLAQLLLQRAGALQLEAQPVGRLPAVPAVQGTCRNAGTVAW